MVGRSLGSYTVERELGRGGMGAVYVATHTLLGRRAALKVLRSELSMERDVVERFFNEARAATTIKHPSIVEIYDFGWAPDGTAYIVMELLEGESLAARLRRVGRLPVAQAVTVTRQIANALAGAHRAGIVHRDLKPDNVFLVRDVEVAGGERIKLLDFGIAKLAIEGAVSRTTTGAILGTPLYMSPEQCEGAREIDARSDLYSLGCMLFEMITGRAPFQSEGAGGLIGMHLHVPAPALRSLAPTAPADVEAVVARLLAKAPTDRYQHADEVAVALGAPAPADKDHLALASTLPGPAPLVAKEATTLSTAAGVTSSPPTRRARAIVWLGVAALATLAVAAIVALSSSDNDRPTASAPIATAPALPAIDAAPSSAPDAIPADAAGSPSREDPRTLAALDVTTAAETGACPQARKALVKFERWFGKDPDLSRVVASCRSSRPLAPAAARPIPQASAVADANPGASPQSPPLEFRPAWEEARTAFAAGQYEIALERCMQASSIRPGDADVHELCALAACHVKRADLANRHASHVDATRYAAIQKSCTRHGVVITDRPAD